MPEDTGRAADARREGLGFDAGGKYVGLSFSELVLKTVDSLIDGKPVSHHVSPQIASDDELEFIRSLGLAARFVDLSRFSEGLSEITRSLVPGRQPSIPHLNASSQAEGWIRNESTGNELVCSRELALERRTPTKESLLTESLSARLIEAFARDFALFRYDQRRSSRWPISERLGFRKPMGGKLRARFRSGLH